MAFSPTFDNSENIVPEGALLTGVNLNVIPPKLKSDESFIIQITGDGLWQWRQIMCKALAFEALNESLRPLGYRISPTGRGRIAQCLYKAIHSFKKKASSRLLGKCDKDRLISKKIYELEVKSTEVAAMLQDVINDLERRQKEMEEEINKLKKELEEQSRKVYSVLVEQIEMKRRLSIVDGLGNKGKKIQEVNERQARRKLAEMR